MRVVQLHLRCTIWKVVCLSGQTRADQWLMLTMQKLHTPIHITLCLVNCWTAVYGEIKFKILSVERYHTVCVVSNNWHSMWYFIKSLYIAKETRWCEDIKLLLSLPNNVWRLIVFAPFLIITCIIILLLSFFPWHMNLSTADLRNYWTEFHEAWWSYRYMFLVGPKVFSFVVKGVKVIFWGVQRGWRLL